MSQYPKQQQQSQVPSILPTAAWMWKPRSKKVIEGNLGGVAASFFGVRNLGAREWKRRYAFVEGNAVCYGRGVGRREKVIPLEAIRAANYATRDVLLAAQAPRSKADFGWFMYINGKELLFCCENEAIRKEWVTFILAALQLMSGLARPVPLTPGSEGSHTISALVARCIEQERRSAVLHSRTSSRAIHSNANASIVRGTDADDEVKLHLQGKMQSEPLQSPREERDEKTETGAELSSHTADENLEDYMSGEEESVGHALRLPIPASSASPKGPADIHARVLLPKAWQRYSHIEYKLAALSEHFKQGDGLPNVVFSRCVEKIGKHDTVQERDLIVTPRYLYLIAQNRLTGGAYARCIDTSQVVGVIESTVEKNVLAILVPSFHDVLIRFHKQNSRVGGDEAEVKLQLIAHLYKIHLDHHSGQRFIFREVENVKAVIRRSVDEQHLPLMSRPEDRMHAGTNQELFPIFRAHAESVVFWSSMVMRIKEDRQLQLRALIITDGAVYLVSDTMVKVSHRISLTDVLTVQFDRDSQNILLHCTEVDTLFTVQSSGEFARLVELVPEVVLQCNGVKISATPSKQLYAQAQLTELCKLKDSPSPQTASDAVKRSIMIPRRVLSSVKPVWLRSYFGKLKGNRAETPVVGADDLENDLLEKTPGSREFLVQYRFVEELILEFEDEWRMLLGTPSLKMDMLALNRSFSTDFDVGRIQYSSLCCEFDVRSFPGGTVFSDNSLRQHGVRRVVCISTNGILLLRHSDEVGRLRRAFKSPLLGGRVTTGSDVNHIDSIGTQDPRVAVFLAWPDVIGIIQCRAEYGTVVGIMTGSGQSCDYMLDVESKRNMEWFISSSAQSYVKRNRRPPHAYEMLPLYTVPRAENVRNALKKTVFDPKPTIALRSVMKRYACDDLHLAVVPEIAEACRRFGDNAIYFSGVAWRCRASVLKKMKQQQQQFPLPPDSPVKDGNPPRSSTHKAFIIVITNCAIYWCTNDGLDIVRRTELLDLKEVYLSRAEPDALLITVPKEYDMYFSIDNRGNEFLAQLQEAYALWTDYDLYLPNERRGYRHNIAEYALPTTTLTHIASLGHLEKPSQFDKMQANRSAKETKTRMESLHRRYLAAAIAKHEAALKTASRRHLPDKRSDSATDTGAFTWEEVYKSLNLSKTVLEFAHRRAYRFSLRSTTHHEVARAQMLLDQFMKIALAVEHLQKSILTGDLDMYEAAIERATEHDSLRVLVEVHREKHEKLKRQKFAVNAITEFLCSSTRPPLKEAEGTLQALFEKAMESDVRVDLLDKLRLRVDLCGQQEKFIAQLQVHQRAIAAGIEEMPTEKVMVLLLEAARQLEVPVSSVEEAFPIATAGGVSGSEIQEESSRKTNKATRDAIDAAALLGDAALLKCVLRFAERCSSDELTEKIRWGWDQLDRHREHHAAHNTTERLVERITARRKIRDWGLAEVLELRGFCEEALRQLPSDLPFARRDRRLMQLQMSILEEEEHRLTLHGSMQRQAKEAQDRYEAELRQKEEYERHATEKRERQEAEVSRRRRAECLQVWQSRTRKLCASLDDAMRSSSFPYVRQYVQHCVVFQKDLQCGPSTYATSPAERGVQHSIDKMLAHLKAATARGQEFLAGHGTGTGNYAALDLTDGSAEGAAVVPPELQQLIDTHKPRELVEYVQSHEGELMADVIAKVRTLWLASAEQRLWVSRLHRGIHNAFTLKNTELLQTHIDAARAAGYMDDVVDGAIEVLAAMRARQQAAVVTGSSNSKNGGGEDEDEGKDPPQAKRETPMLAEESDTHEGAPLILEVSRVYDPHSAEPAERLMGQLHVATLEMLQFTGKRPLDEAAKSREGYEKKLSDVVQLWHSVFHHRLKPSGSLFRKTERDVFDFLRFVGQYNVSGDYLAPYTNRLLSDFERIKKYNATRGRSSSYILIAYMLQQKLLERAVYEIAQLGPRGRGEVLFKDALLNYGLHDLLVLARLGEQADWSSMVSGASAAYNPIAREMTVDEKIGVGTTPGEQQGKLGDVPRPVVLQYCIELLRSAVGALSNYFAHELAVLGLHASAENARGLFDEGLHKESGLIVQERLLPAVVALLGAGFRTSHGLVRTHRVWDAVKEFAAHLQEGTRDLNGVAVGGALQLVSAITDEEGRNRNRLQRLNGDELADMRLRMFLIECLNRRVLAAFLQVFFQGEEGTTRWATKDGLWKFYDRQQCVCFPPDDEGTKDLMDVIAMVSELPFVLVVDRELW
ncbi:putative protein kinase [Trypanosoma grayi]|uniref:putative protein kinase n=1 Tax=Trypanosoma grayi TaxID=71804 RepID=UPI0004F4722C|nr:putative protein kinase [Trypanosoma grayi]KEG11797.1 putative protein kinase [Trypanosoma grayi]